MHSFGVGKAQLPKRKLEALLLTKGLPKYTPKTLSRTQDLYAGLEITSHRGWSFDQEERYEGMSCVGAAIRNS